MVWRAFLVLALCLVAGCSIADRRAGIPNRWQETRSKERFVPGRTLEREVLEVLGPPSQVIELHERTVFYYLLEDSHTWQLTLILYNHSDTRVRYDRAIFFFDAKGVLEEFALSPRPLPPEEEKD